MFHAVRRNAAIGHARGLGRRPALSEVERSERSRRGYFSCTPEPIPMTAAREVPMRSVWLNELTSDDVEAYLKRDDTIIVPIGATETHGPHLPLGTDTFEAVDYSEGIARAAGVLVTPPIWFGDSPHHMGRPGTISIASQTLIDLLKDVYRSLIHHGFTRIVT